MLRLTLLLCVSMFLVLLIGGRDYGQMRPGLVAAAREAATPPAATAQAQAAPAPEEAVVEASFAAAPDPVPDPVTERLSLPVVVRPAPEALVETLVAESAPVAEPALFTEPEGPVFLVSAEAVNVREGPSTRDPVLDRLTEGEAVTVLWTDDTGWARIRIEGDGVEGFVYADYLIPALGN